MHELEEIHRELVKAMASCFHAMGSLEFDDDDDAVLRRFRRERVIFAQLVNIGRRLDCVEGAVTACHMMRGEEKVGTFEGMPSESFREAMSADGFTFVETTTEETLALADRREDREGSALATTSDRARARRCPGLGP